MTADIPGMMVLHALCAAVYAILVGLILVRSRLSRTGLWLAGACAVTSAWAAAVAWDVYYRQPRRRLTFQWVCPVQGFTTPPALMARPVHGLYTWASRTVAPVHGLTTVDAVPTRPVHGVRTVTCR